MKSNSTLECELRLAVLKAAFERLAPDLESFAERHALCIVRCERGFSIWTFQFQHPKGGTASLQLSINVTRETGDLRVAVLTQWWVDLADERRCLAADFPPAPVPGLEAADVLGALERALEHVRAADECELTRPARANYWMAGMPR